MAAHEQAEQRLGELAKKVKASGVSASVEVRFGEVDREIIKAIQESKANLVVAGTHGRRAALSSGSSGLVVNSQADATSFRRSFPPSARC
jgi:nucleotide-binding universal stress UspA family protein